MSELDSLIENLLFSLQNQALEVNEYKMDREFVHVDNYIQTLNIAIEMTRNYQEEREMNKLFSKSIGKSLGVPYYE